MTSPCATTSTFGDRAGETTSRAVRRELRRQARRRKAQTGCRVAGLVAVLLVGVSATAAGVSADPAKTPKAYGASETRDLGAVDLAVARRSVTARPVEGVLLTQAAAEQQQRAVEAWVFTARVNQAKAQAQAAVAQGVAQAAVAKAAAARAATPAPAPVPAQHTGVNWDGIARCETGGNWSMQGSRYSGGLGFANSTWSSFGGGQFAANAGQASREQQIVVAERVYARYGLSGWGCRRFG